MQQSGLVLVQKGTYLLKSSYHRSLRSLALHLSFPAEPLVLSILNAESRPLSQGEQHVDLHCSLWLVLEQFQFVCSGLISEQYTRPILRASCAQVEVGSSPEVDAQPRAQMLPTLAGSRSCGDTRAPRMPLLPGIHALQLALPWFVSQVNCLLQTV